MTWTDRLKVVETTCLVQLAHGLEEPPGTVGRLVGRADDGRPLVQFPHQRRPWLLEREEVRLKYPFAGFGLAQQNEPGPPQHALLVVAHHSHINSGELVTELQALQGQASLACAGLLAANAWKVALSPRAGAEGLITVLVSPADWPRFERAVGEVRVALGMDEVPFESRWRP